MMTRWNLLSCAAIAGVTAGFISLAAQIAGAFAGILIHPPLGYMLLAAFASSLLTIVVIVWRNPVRA